MMSYALRYPLIENTGQDNFYFEKLKDMHIITISEIKPENSSNKLNAIDYLAFDDTCKDTVGSTTCTIHISSRYFPVCSTLQIKDVEVA